MRVQYMCSGHLHAVREQCMHVHTVRVQCMCSACAVHEVHLAVDAVEGLRVEHVPHGEQRLELVRQLA